MLQRNTPDNHVSFFLLDAGKTPVWSFTRQSRTSAGILLDFSPFGARLLVPRQVMIEQPIIRLSIDNDFAEPVYISAIQAWSRQRHLTDCNEVGLSFTNLDNHTKLALMRLIQNSRFNRQQLIRCEVSCS